MSPAPSRGRSLARLSFSFTKVPDDPAAATEALKFFSWAYEKGGKLAEELDYVPLPQAVVALIKKSWAAEIKGADGKPLVN